MSQNSDIQWTDATWNPTTGCTKISSGCLHCYIERTPPFRMAGRKFDKKGHIPLIIHEDRLDTPLHWKKPRRVFVNSLSDLFHKDVPTAFIQKVLFTIRECPQHIFQVLTKRPARMAEEMDRWVNGCGHPVFPNLWLGTSIENQEQADQRIPQLLKCPAAVRFLSVEPLLGEIDLLRIDAAGFGGPAGHKVDCIRKGYWSKDWGFTNHSDMHREFGELHWVIVGGESGPGARPCCIQWIEDIVRQCADANVACFVKQVGSKPVVRDSGRGDEFTPDAPGYSQMDYMGRPLSDSKGGNPDEWPEDLRVRQFPQTKEPICSQPA